MIAILETRSPTHKPINSAACKSVHFSPHTFPTIPLNTNPLTVAPRSLRAVKHAYVKPSTPNPSSKAQTSRIVSYMGGRMLGTRDELLDARYSMGKRAILLIHVETNVYKKRTINEKSSLNTKKSSNNVMEAVSKLVSVNSHKILPSWCLKKGTYRRLPAIDAIFDMTLFVFTCVMFNLDIKFRE